MNPSCSEQRLNKDPTLSCCWLLWATDVNVFKDKYSGLKPSSWIHSYKPIVDYIDTQFENYLQEELKIKRSLFNYHDTRIHICLYFISPTGHSLKSLDLVTMKKLDSKVRSADTDLLVRCHTWGYLIPLPPPHPPLGWDSQRPSWKEWKNVAVMQQAPISAYRIFCFRVQTLTAPCGGKSARHISFHFPRSCHIILHVN